MVFIICLLSYIVEFVVKAARVADRLPVRVPPPQGRLSRLAVSAGGPLAPCCALLKVKVEINTSTTGPYSRLEFVLFPNRLSL